jgi:O-antigen/teichoic acid export membrane protein
VEKSVNADAEPTVYQRLVLRGQTGNNPAFDPMSRLKNFTRSLLSGYVMLGANIFFTLASVPLALHYLDKPQFALWMLVAQIAGYIALIDAGSSISRILIDHKDDRSTGAYGGTIQTGALVGLAQGALIVITGVALSLLGGSLLAIPEELREKFAWLMIVQSILLGTIFATRIFSQLLIVHQRQDVTNYGSGVSFFLGLGAMWLGFRGGWGIYSYLGGTAIMVLVVFAVNLAGCFRLGLFPKGKEWGRSSRSRFGEMFVFGQGMFLIAIGSQMINTSQVILLTRIMDLEAAATWTVCTRAFTMITMVIWRILDFSAPGLGEMVVRQERERFQGRMRDLALLMAGLSVVGGAIFALTNGPFVHIWTAGKISWPPINDILLALWLLACSLTRTLTSLPIFVKKLQFLRFIFLVEGLVFIGLNLLAYRVESTTLMLVFSLVSTLMFSLPYGLWRVREYFGISWRELLAWFRPTWRLAWRLLPVAVAVGWLTLPLPPRWQFVINVAVPGIWGGAVLLKYGLGEALQAELQSKVPFWIRKILVHA